MTGITYPSSATNSFSYNGDDLRVGKTDSTGTFANVTDGTAIASPILTDGAATYTPGLSEHRGTASKFYHSDAPGSTRGITNGSQSVTDSTLFDAFGMTVSHSGTTATPFGFVGGSQYQTDNDSGLMLLGHRYYDASIGRFISSDPAQAGDNWYAYCENNPLSGIDPEGLDHDAAWHWVHDGVPNTPPHAEPIGRPGGHIPIGPGIGIGTSAGSAAGGSGDAGIAAGVVGGGGGTGGAGGGDTGGGENQKSAMMCTKCLTT